MINNNTVFNIKNSLDNILNSQSSNQLPYGTVPQTLPRTFKLFSHYTDEVSGQKFSIDSNVADSDGYPILL